MKTVLLSVALVLASTSAHALRLEYFGETSIPTGTKYEKTTIGGLSAITWQNNTLYALSDDKGRAGDPRFYEFDLKLGQQTETAKAGIKTDGKKTVVLTPKAVHFVTNLPKEGERKALLDPEGLVRLPDGDLLISSEGSNDAKPRAMPRIFRVTATGEWKSDFPIPDKYLPETIGQQTKGIQNNLAFESLTSIADGKFVFTSTESCLAQDIVSGKEAEGDTIRILKFEDKGPLGYKPVAEFAYHVDAFKDNQKGPEVFRGVSEILALSETKLLVMERGVRMVGKSWAQTIGIYLVDLSKATNTLEINKLEGAKYQVADKVKLIDFETDLNKERSGKTIQNFEGLAWGPTLPDGRRSLLVMVDNNFSKYELTEFVVFAVEGE
ncbi:esterase-like activity of phytase family protein [Bdellovibrio svalbardensis]|uniref:Esterase-like activity of phytase family protein n=1 Tax=Bdellovibrio svalbardensis TaxID=2972972 RepID=A0ABT6DHR3_9BACT|nr:esterase-like activity of phytase family protein [Bdellovibrio svalbardensis]MDG0815464.1 esterase-like activity of phytase family protein [Bdellovibrio svalbardensis]